MMYKVAATLATVCITFGIVSAATDKVVCYHGVWSYYRSNNGLFTVDNIDPTLCTHLIYSFIGIEEDGNVKHLETNLDLNLGNIKRFNDLKLKNKNLKTLVAIGGYNEGSTKYSAVASSAAKRATFVKSALNFVQKWGFDGFDLDWEYPGQRGGRASDKENFASLIKEFRKEFDKHGLLLTAAVAAVGDSVDLSYNVPALSQYLDFINVMAYDLHGPWDNAAGQNAPLYASSADVTWYQQQLNVDSAIRGWIQRGANPQKLVLGLGAYGRSYILADSRSNRVGAPAVAGGNPGPYTGEGGMLGYNEIVELQKEGGWTIVWDDNQKTPYMYKGNQWVGYDDPRSVTIKVEYAKSLNLGGAMVWSIETDDFRGLSGSKFQLLRTINQALGVPSNENAVHETKPEPETKPEAPPIPEAIPEPEPVPPTIPVPGQASGNVCTKEGYERDPVDCSIFYYCLPNNGVFVPLELKCNSGLVFDKEKLECGYPYNVKC